VIRIRDLVRKGRHIVKNTRGGHGLRWAGDRKYLIRVTMGITPTPLQAEVIHSTEPRKICVWGRQCGKTTTSVLWINERALSIPDSIHWYCAPTYKMAKRIVWDRAKATIPAGVLKRRPNETELCFEYINGSKLYLIGADDPDSLRGPALTSVVLDEYGTWRKGVWEAVLMPTLATTGGHALFTGTPNASRGQHFRELWEINQGNPDWYLRKARSADSPFITPEFIAAAKAGQREQEFLQEMEAEFLDLTGRVWHEYVDELCTNEAHPGHLFAAATNHIKPPYGWRVVAGVDFGHTAPTAIVFLGIGPSGQTRVLGEYMGCKMRADEHARLLYQICEVYGGVDSIRWVHDPEDPGAAAEFRKEGIIMEPANNDRHAGYERVGRMMRHKYVLLNDKCENLRKELLNYIWDHTKEGKDVVVKKHDHLCDAFRYAMMAAEPPYAIAFLDSEERARYGLDDGFYKNTTPDEIFTANGIIGGS